MDCKTFCCFAIVAVTWLQSASGNVIPIGTSGPPDVFTGQAAGTLLANMTAPFSIAGTTSGDLVSAVFREASGTLDFYYQVDVTSTASAINFLNVFGFTGFSGDEGYRTDGASLPGGVFVDGTVNPSSVFRATDRIAFTITGVGADQSSSVLEVQTAATAFVSTASALVAGGDGQSDVLATFGPAVPEPSSMLLIAGGLLAIGAVMRLRKSSYLI